MKLRIETPDLPQNFYSKTIDLLRECDSICSTLYAKGYTLTLRQLFYQLVSRNRIENTEKAYKNLGDVVTNGRYAGLLDWEHITDRVRVIHGNPRWDSVEDRLQHASETHQIDTWKTQDYRPEIWLEKDALIELAEHVCTRLDVDYIAVKAYNSASALWEARKRFRQYIRDGQTPVILHLGDHDATGDDCSRFLKERMSLMVGHPIELRRLALNRDQIDKYQLPPQPGKTTDPRFRGYVEKYGTTHTWELDALSPEVIEKIIEDGIREVLDDDARQVLIGEQESQRKSLTWMSDNWVHVDTFRAVVQNGHRDGYEAWLNLSNVLENQGVAEKSGIPDFQPLRENRIYPIFRSPAPPVATERDADIADEYAAIISRAQEPDRPTVRELAQRLSAKWRNS